MKFLKEIMKEFGVWIIIICSIFYIFTYYEYSIEFLNLKNYLISIITITIFIFISYIIKYKNNSKKMSLKKLIYSYLTVLILPIIFEIFNHNQNDWLTFPIYYIVFLITQTIFLVGYLILYWIKNWQKNKVN